MYPINKLTSEQESLLSVYCEKWKQIVLSTERIDRDRATATIRKAYAISELSEPEMIFCESPLVAIRELKGRSLKNRRRQLHTYLLQQLHDHFSRRLGQQCDEELHQYISNQVSHQTNTKGLSALFSLLKREFIRTLSIEFKYSGISVEYLLNNSIQPNSWIRFICWFDYCSSVLFLELIHKQKLKQLIASPSTELMSHESSLHSPRCITRSPCSIVEIDSANQRFVLQSTASVNAQTFWKLAQSPRLAPDLPKPAGQHGQSLSPSIPGLPKSPAVWTTSQSLHPERQWPLIALKHWPQSLRPQSTILGNLR